MSFKYERVRGYYGHPMAHKNGTILKHRLVMSEVLGRPLEKYEVVHHIDGNTKNNAPENLELHDIHSHPSIHAKVKAMISLSCDFCGKSFEKRLAQYEHGLRNGQKTFCCSRSCSASITQNSKRGL